MTDRVVHILHEGLALCGAGTPTSWDNELWVCAQHVDDATCQGCIAAHGRARPAPESDTLHELRALWRHIERQDQARRRTLMEMTDDKLTELVTWTEANYPVPQAAQGASAHLAGLRHRAEALPLLHPELIPPAEEFVVELVARLKNPALIATARDLLLGAHTEMQATKGTEHGLIVVFAHVLGEIGAVYAVEKGEDILPVLAVMVRASRDGAMPLHQARRAELERARGPKIIT